MWRLLAVGRIDVTLSIGFDAPANVHVHRNGLSPVAQRSAIGPRRNGSRDAGGFPRGVSSLLKRTVPLGACVFAAEFALRERDGPLIQQAVRPARVGFVGEVWLIGRSA